MKPMWSRRILVKAQAIAQRAEVGVAEPGAARCQRVESGEAMHQRALAGSGRAHHSGETAGRQAGADAVGRTSVPPRAVDLDCGLGTSG